MVKKTTMKLDKAANWVYVLWMFLRLSGMILTLIPKKVRK